MAMTNPAYYDELSLLLMRNSRDANFLNFCCIASFVDETSPQVCNNGFTAMSKLRKNFDPSGGFDNATGRFTVPANGIYLCLDKVQIRDSAPRHGYGHGVHSSNAFGAWFLWETTTDPASGFVRNGALNFRMAQFNKGDQLRLYVWSDVNDCRVTSAEMVVYFLGPTP